MDNVKLIEEVQNTEVTEIAEQEMIKYPKVKRMDNVKGFELRKGDYIFIQEKIDGANASFMLTEEGEVKCFSRNKELSESEGLRGFYQWVQEKIVPQKDKLAPMFIYFGEWLCQHTAQYEKDFYGNFYLFDIYVKPTGELVDPIHADGLISELGIYTVPRFYYGEYLGIEQLEFYIGKTMLRKDNEGGEGIVIYNETDYDRTGVQQKIKMVSPKFLEKKGRGGKIPKVVSKDYEELTEIVKSVLTEARVEKMMHKLVDESLIEEDGLVIQNMAKILKAMGDRVYVDILEEEEEMFEGKDLDMVKKICGKNVPKLVKEIILNK